MQNTVKVIKAIRDNLTLNSNLNKLKVCAYCRVSTDMAEQLNSFESQKQYYKDKISENKDWEFVDIYADEAVTGTKASVRDGFQRMINDCMEGKIDIIMTKSISRFARNTVDTLHYVRKLKEKNVAVIFEEEHINTLAMEGELLLTILSSVAQQEVSNTSQHVKKGLKMKLQRGELIGLPSCMGYDYDPITKSISINPEEAKIVKYIFERYSEGYGAATISKELAEMKVKTKRGNDRWTETTITGIIRNEKYMGDILFGKTYTIDPISKKRVRNDGQSDKYYMESHHEPIVSKELFKKCNDILDMRSKRKKELLQGEFLDFVGKYTFSKKIHCGFCGNTFTRRRHQQTTTTNKATWKCMKSTKDGALYCPDSKVIDEKTIEDAFVMMMQRLLKVDEATINKFVDKAKSSLMNTTPIKSPENIKKAMESLESRKNQIMDLMLDGTITKEQYQSKVEDIEKRLEEYNKDLNEISNITEKQSLLESKMDIIKELISSNVSIEEYDEDVFEALIKNVIVGGYDEAGNKEPHMITYVLSQDRISTNLDMQYTVIDSFDMPVLFYDFNKDEKGILRRKIVDKIIVRIAVENE